MSENIRKRRFHRAAIGAILTIGLCGAFGGLAPTAVAETADPPHMQGTCGETYDPSTVGAAAHWELSCQDGKIRVKGYVEGTFPPDGQCAKVKARFASGVTEFSGEACGPTEEAYFDWAHPGAIADVYLIEY